MTVRRLVFIANARLPTEKAHGYQICKMCEAFALNGLEVKLIHPYRHQFDSKLEQQSLFDYYGIRPLFEARTLPNWDVVRLERFFPASLFPPIFFAHALMWGLYAARIARRENADFYYTRDSGVAYWLVRLGLPTVYEVHVLPKRGQRVLLQRIAHHPSLLRVVTLASSIKELLLEMGVPSKKVRVHPHGVDLSLFETLPDKQMCRKRLGLPRNRFIIGYLGRFRAVGKEKGIPELVEAMAYLTPENGLDSLLLCVGGPMAAVPAYLDLARRIGIQQEQLQFVDRVSNRELPYWIRSCDLALLPLSQEYTHQVGAMPLKLFEYMAAKVAIVATDLPSIREVLTHRENAWLVEPGNPMALVEAITHLLRETQSRDELADRAAQVVSEYTWTRRAGAVLGDLFCSNLGGDPD